MNDTKEFTYVSSDGTEKDVRQLNTEYLINALAKSHKDSFYEENVEGFITKSNNITALESELLRRQNEHFKNKFGN